jgi:hypothetical protein
MKYSWITLFLVLLVVGLAFAFECPNGECPLGATIQTCPSVDKDENGDCERGATDGLIASLEHLPGRGPIFKWGDLRHKCDFNLEMLALYEIDAEGNFVNGSLTDLAQLNWTICIPSAHGPIVSIDIHGEGLENMTIDIEVSVVKSHHSRLLNFTFELDHYTFTYDVAEDIVLAAIFESDDDDDDDDDDDHHGPDDDDDHDHDHHGPDDDGNDHHGSEDNSDDEDQETRTVDDKNQQEIRKEKPEPKPKPPPEEHPHPPKPPPEEHPHPPKPPPEEHPHPPKPPPHEHPHPPKPPPHEHPHPPKPPHKGHDCSIDETIISAEEIARYTYLPADGGGEITADVDVTSSTSNNGETGFFLIFGTGEYNGTFISLTFEAVLKTNKAVDVKASSAEVLSPCWVGTILLASMIVLIMS